MHFKVIKTTSYSYHAAIGHDWLKVFFLVTLALIEATSASNDSDAYFDNHYDGNKSWVIINATHNYVRYPG